MTKENWRVQDLVRIRERKLMILLPARKAEVMGRLESTSRSGKVKASVKYEPRRCKET